MFCFQNIKIFKSLNSHADSVVATCIGPSRPLPVVDQSILSIFLALGIEGHNEENNAFPSSYMISSDMSWYRPWLAEQIANLPDSLRSLINPQRNSESLVHLTFQSKLYRIFMSVSEFIRQESSPTIDQVIEHLVEKRLLNASDEGSELSLQHRLLVFAILGWQSMLYLPSFGTCPPEELGILQLDDQQKSGLIFETFKVPSDLAERPMAIFLKAYGNLLPAQSQAWDKEANEPTEAALTWFPIDPLETNAHFLQMLLRVDICWVDALSLHLEYDKSTRTLSLFRYPSLCVAMLESRGALYSFASTERNAPDPRANHEEITCILHETLLSYRLLFGQSKRSRRVFRRLFACNPILKHNADPLLHSICTKKVFTNQFVPQDRMTYFGHRDFLVLGDRLEMLGKELKGAKPKGWRDLVRDRRDTMQYWGFWLVAIVGGASIILSLTQVILQAAQFAHS